MIETSLPYPGAIQLGRYYLKFFLAGMLALALTVVAQGRDNLSMAADEDVLAKVGENVFVRKDWETMVEVLIKRGANLEQINKEYEALVIQNFVAPNVISRDIDEIGLRETRTFRERVAASIQQITNELYASYLNEGDVTEEQVRTEYEAFKADPAVRLEYRVRHILVSDRSEAVALIERIKNGEELVDLARQYSIDPASSVKGGDLGFVGASTVVPEFARAMISLEDGAISESPVQTQYGYHVLMRIESRPSQNIPGIERVQSVLVERIFTRVLNVRVQELIKENKYEILPLNQ